MRPFVGMWRVGTHRQVRASLIMLVSTRKEMVKHIESLDNVESFILHGCIIMLNCIQHISYKMNGVVNSVITSLH